VDYASVIGHAYRGRSRRDLGLPNRGPAALFTSHLVFRPDPDGVLQPAQILSGDSWPEILGEVGWDVHDAKPERLVPAPDEVRLLREHVDVDGLLHPDRMAR
jgi:hypothetical protein